MRYKELSEMNWRGPLRGAQKFLLFGFQLVLSRSKKTLGRSFFFSRPKSLHIVKYFVIWIEIIQLLPIEKVQ